MARGRERFINLKRIHERPYGQSKLHELTDVLTSLS